MRLYEKTVLYWQVTDTSDDAVLPDIVPTHMLPVKPRRLMQVQLTQTASTSAATVTPDNSHFGQTLEWWCD
jgi:hypothetical protein